MRKDPYEKMVVDLWSKSIVSYKFVIWLTWLTWLLTIFSSDSKLESYYFELQVKFDLEIWNGRLLINIAKGKGVPEPEFTPSY